MSDALIKPSDCLRGRDRVRFQGSNDRKTPPRLIKKHINVLRNVRDIAVGLRCEVRFQLPSTTPRDIAVDDEGTRTPSVDAAVKVRRR